MSELRLSANLGERACKVFREIRQNHAESAIWGELEGMHLEQLAQCCDNYLASIEGGKSEAETEEWRVLARSFLADFGIISEAQIPIGEVDRGGIDVQIKRLAYDK